MPAMGRRVRSGICILLSLVAGATTSCGDGPEQPTAAGGSTSGRAGANTAGTSHGGLAGDSGASGGDPSMSAGGSRSGAGGKPAFASAGEAGGPAIAEGGAAAGGSEAGGQAGAEATPTAGVGGEGGAADGVGHCGDFAALGTSPVSTRALTKVADASWSITQDTAGIAVDANQRVYVAVFDKVYVVDGASVSEYLTIDEARSTAGLAPSGIDSFYDMDSAPDGSLFLLTRDGVLRSTSAHSATLWQRTNQTQFLLGVVANDEVAIIRDFYGLFSLNGTAASQLYTSQQLQGTNNCATQDLAISTHGVFLYQPGCNGSSLMRGRIDGSKVERFYEAEPAGINPMNANNFLCAARDPLGGFYVIGQTPDGSQLYHLCEGATRYAGYNQIPTTPSFTEAANGSLKFRYCSLVAASDGTVFIQSYNQVWRVTPP